MTIATVNAVAATDGLDDALCVQALRMLRITAQQWGMGLEGRGAGFLRQRPCRQLLGLTGAAHHAGCAGVLRPQPLL